MRLVLSEYLVHFHTERNYQRNGSLQLFPTAMKEKNRVYGLVSRKKHSGGLLKYTIGRPHEYFDRTGESGCSF